MTTLDRTIPALVSDDLGMSPLHAKDADYIAALGYTSRVYKMASPLVRLYMAHDRSALAEAKRIAYDMVQTECRRQNKRLSVKDMAWIAKHALQYAANPNCPECSGTKYKLIPGTRTLSDTACHYCKGDGRRKFPTQHRKIIVGVVARIERIESSLDGLIRSRV